MNGMLSYPETRHHDRGLFRGLFVEFLVEVGLDGALDLLTCLLETL
jgi:hypothetical protein